MDNKGWNLPSHVGSPPASKDNPPVQVIPEQKQAITVSRPDFGPEDPSTGQLVSVIKTGKSEQETIPQNTTQPLASNAEKYPGA